MNEVIGDLFAGLPMFVNMGLFVLVALVVWVAGSHLALYADTIADRKRIGKALMGLVFLAAATELPELVTTITAAINNNASLVLNNMFGGITMQTAILAIADLAALHATLTFFPRKTTLALQGMLLILLLSCLLAVISLGDLPLIGNLGAGTFVLGFAYMGVIQFLRKHDQNTGWRPVDVPDDETTALGNVARKDLETIAFSRLYLLTAAAIIAILVAGLILVQLSEVLAVQTGLGNSFIGVTLLAASTSLPELSTTISAVRLGAYTMAIANIFGSNLIMVALLFPADIFYTNGRILEEVDRTAQFALLSGIIVTSIYVIGLIVRSRKRVFGMGVDSLGVLVVYLASLTVFYYLAQG